MMLFPLTSLTGGVTVVNASGSRSGTSYVTASAASGLVPGQSATNRCAVCKSFECHDQFHTTRFSGEFLI